LPILGTYPIIIDVKKKTWTEVFLKTNNMFKKLINYLRESRDEMKKVVWPSKDQTRNYTIIVILMSVGMAFFFALLDYIFNLGLGKII
jgi:preprotein translocase subunit SecE